MLNFLRSYPQAMIYSVSIIVSTHLKFVKIYSSLFTKDIRLRSQVIWLDRMPQTVIILAHIAWPIFLISWTFAGRCANFSQCGHRGNFDQHISNTPHLPYRWNPKISIGIYKCLYISIDMDRSPSVSTRSSQVFIGIYLSFILERIKLYCICTLCIDILCIPQHDFGFTYSQTKQNQ